MGDGACLDDVEGGIPMLTGSGQFRSSHAGHAEGIETFFSSFGLSIALNRDSPMWWPFSKRRIALPKVHMVSGRMVMMSAVPQLDPVGWSSESSVDGTDSLNADPQHKSNLAEAEERFHADVSALLRSPENLGLWVLYHREGRVAEGRDEGRFYREYGQEIGIRYFLGRVQPPPPDAEVTANWFVPITRAETDRNPTPRR
jgi:hypothetical protein